MVTLLHRHIENIKFHKHHQAKCKRSKFCRCLPKKWVRTKSVSGIKLSKLYDKMLMLALFQVKGMLRISSKKLNRIVLMKRSLVFCLKCVTITTKVLLSLVPWKEHIQVLNEYTKMTFMWGKNQTRTNSEMYWYKNNKKCLFLWVFFLNKYTICLTKVNFSFKTFYTLLRCKKNW